MFDENEKKLLRWLVEKEIKRFEEEESEIRPMAPQFLAIEDKYDSFLKKLMEKLE